MTNLGMIASLEGRIEEARARFEEAMRLNREVGDSWMVAISHNNLGNANRGLGDYAAARRDYAASLRAHLEHDDSWALAFLLEDVGRLAALTGDPQLALELLGAADALREEIGVPRTASLEQEILRDVDPAIAALTSDQQGAARYTGGHSTVLKPSTWRSHLTNGAAANGAAATPVFRYRFPNMGRLFGWEPGSRGSGLRVAIAGAAVVAVLAVLLTSVLNAPDRAVAIPAAVAARPSGSSLVSATLSFSVTSGVGHVFRTVASSFSTRRTDRHLR